jgi:hypothetical protein
MQSQDPDRTPFQRSVMAKIEERQALGLPVPADVSFECTSTDPSALQGGRGPTIVPGEEIVITATTVLHFEHPSEAGNEKWPAIVVEGEVPPDAEGHIEAGDYSEVVRDKVEEEVPDAWTLYEWGYEPRTYTFTETYTISYPELNLSGSAFKNAALSTKVNEILMGFSIPGPDLDYSISWDFEVLGVTVIDFWAGFELDWGLGVRLPMEESCTATEPMDEGSTYWPTNTVDGMDWSASDFATAGVPAENGNEFVMRFTFKFGVFLWVPIAGNVIDLGVDIDIDHSQSFPTPFGPGSWFPIPPLDIPLWGLDVGVAYGEIGFELTPYLGSTKLTSDWTAVGDASGSGSMMFTDPVVPVTIGPVQAIDGPGTAEINMEDWQYYFNEFILDLGLYFYLDVFGVWDGTFTVPIVDFDLSAITGHLWIGTHSGTPDQLTAAFTIQNVAPTAVIDRTGTYMVDGVQTFVAVVGDVLTFTGEADDPGYDDLDLMWDYDDGTPSPDVSTHYTVPYHVTETQTHTITDACVYMVTFSAIDDDGAIGMDQVPVVVTGTGNRVRSEGYWQHQLGGQGKVNFSPAELQCALDIASHMSAVFSEVRDASTPEAGYDVMHLGHNDGSMIEQLDRELLAVWLNFAVGACPYLGLVDTDFDDVDDTPFADALVTAEAVRLNPASTDAELEMQVEILHRINHRGPNRLN